MLRPEIREERGMTLVELMVASAIMSVVLLVFTNVLASVQRSVVETDVRERLADDARLALQSLDRLVRSGNLLYSPDEETDPYGGSTGMLFRLYTQAKFSPTDEPRCYAWLIDDQGRLLSRWWLPLEADEATDWRVVVESVTNRAETPPVPAFDLNDDTARTVNVTLRLNPDLEDRPEATQEFQTSLTGRNTSFGYPDDVCDPLPSGMNP